MNPSLSIGADAALIRSQGFTQAAPHAKIVTTHMDAINHMAQTRQELKAYVQEKHIQDRVEIPEDGATLMF